MKLCLETIISSNKKATYRVHSLTNLRSASILCCLKCILSFQKLREGERKEKKRGKRGRKEGRKGRKEGRNEGRKEGRGDHNLFIYHWGYKRPETWDLDLLPGIGPYRPFESGCEEGSRETLSLHQEGLPLGTQKAHERGNQIHYVWCLRVTYWLCGLSELWFHFL